MQYAVARGDGDLHVVGYSLNVDAGCRKTSNKRQTLAATQSSS